MDIIQAVLLGVVQGVAEWLPVSSEGMISLAGRLLLGMTYREALSTAVWLHAGTMAAAIVYFREEIKSIVYSIFSGDSDRRLLIFLTVSTLATFPTGFTLLRVLFQLEIPSGPFTLMVGVLLLAVSAMHRLAGPSGRLTDKTILSAALTGFIQGFSVIPGVSRSGVTITALLYQGYPLKDALTLSYLMSIPVTAGVQILLPLAGGGLSLGLSDLVALVAAALTGYAVIRFMIRFSEKFSLTSATIALGAFIAILGALLTLFQ